MPRVRVHTSLYHGYSAFHATTPGDYDFPDDPRYLGWLMGMCERGVCSLIVPDPEPEPKPTRRKKSP